MKRFLIMMLLSSLLLCSNKDFVEVKAAYFIRCAALEKYKEEKAKEESAEYGDDYGGAYSSYNYGEDGDDNAS